METPRAKTTGTTANPEDDREDLKERVRRKYAAIAEGAGASCCGPSGCGPDAGTTYMGESYAATAGYDAEADLGLGCGLPTEAAALQPGETVLDLGSGAGVDAFVARRLVGAEGRVLGVDMTPAMVDKARRNAGRLGYDNVAFLLGEIEALPVADESVDCIVSNCVLNLVPDKARAFQEMHRVLRAGGRFAVSDIVSSGPLPAAIGTAAALHAGCISGAIPKDDYLALLEAAGFAGVAVARERPITLPDELLRAHLADDERATFRASGAGLLSVTVTGVRLGDAENR